MLIFDDIANCTVAKLSVKTCTAMDFRHLAFSQLAIPVQSLLPGDENHTKVLEMGTKRSSLNDSEGGNQPFYLSPDPKQV
ncbi:hypothetical protein [Escherichia coli]|uniref:hypothetical protein n=1 Tax=Escherichia coli TaxID=562 RepID=UPI003F5CD067